MLLTSERDILRAYAEGHIGWREAARRLDIEKFSELDERMKVLGLKVVAPDPDESRSRMDRIDSLLYEEDEI